MNPSIPFIHEFGAPDGHPLVFFHGFPGSHRQAFVLEPWAKKFDIRVLAVDRPGYGFSHPKSGSCIKSFLKNLEITLNERGIDRFYLVGVSGGNPAAVSAAGYFGERVVALGSVCGLAPFHEAEAHFPEFHRRGLRITSRIPAFVLRPILGRALRAFDPDQRIERLMRRLHPKDGESLSHGPTRQILVESITLASRQGAAGLVFDLKSFSSPWPVNWESIRCPYHIWHGQMDRILPWQMATHLNSRVKHSKLKIYPDEGHYSLPLNRTGEILKDLTELAVAR